MSGEINITEYYSVSCRPFDADGDGASLLEKARRGFFLHGGESGSVRSVENGQEVRTRYRLGPRRFRWKKICGRVTLQEAFAVADGCFRLVTHDPGGRLLSSHTYDAGLRWLRTAYYDGDPADPAAVLRRGDSGLFLLLRGGEETFLAPCPWEPGTAAQSFVNAKAGVPLVTARTDAGDFCFCGEEERALRLERRGQAAEAPLRLGEQQEDTLDFRVIPNDPASGWTIPAVGQGGNPARSLAGERKESSQKQPSFLSDVHENPTSDRSPQGCGGVSGVGYAANLEISFSPQTCPGGRPGLQSRPGVQPDENGGTDLPGELSPTPGGASKRYAVAAKGLTGGIRSGGGRPGGVSPLPRPGVQPDENGGSNSPGELLQAPDGSSENIPKPSHQTGLSDFSGLNGGAKQALPVIPAKRIVVSSLESYLYFGRLMDGLRQGRGRTAMPDGRTAYEGGYRDDLRDGFGVYYRKSGELCYAGEWKRSLRDGLGVAFGAKDGSIFVGRWKNDVATGPGSEFDLSGCLTYTGGWKDGRRHGYGTEYRGGRVWRSGMWRDDVFCEDEAPSGPAAR